MKNKHGICGNLVRISHLYLHWDFFSSRMFLLLLLLSHFSRVRLCVIPQMAATRLPRPWDSPGKNTGVGCHFLLQCMKVKSEREVTQSCPTLSDPMDCSPPGSSIHRILQANYWSGVPLHSLIVIAGNPFNKFKDIEIKSLKFRNCQGIVFENCLID